ncbi:hypothetical protein [Methylotenera sp. N17]|uniref:hypothetical protein n=1 Tax=Methylotenera sp. N17 TaxID=1502761 RepID=UPI000690774D|nr:hypothetical protein [Methylotenera sp. N17]
MKQTKLIIGVVTLALAGCALVKTNQLSDDVLTQRTAFTLGLDKSEFTITNRQEPNKSSEVYYLVTTKSGRKFNCYVAAGFTSIVTPNSDASDAVCSEIGGSSGSSSGNSKGKACNALLKAAGKC